MEHLVHLSLELVDVVREALELLPLAAVLYLTLPDVRKPRSRKWYAATFVGAVLWIGVFSYFMVWWATTIGHRPGAGPRREHQRANRGRLGARRG